MTATKSIALRRERPADIAAIREVETSAFGRPAEPDLVDALRAASALILSGVAEIDGNVAGHIAFTTVTIESEREDFGAIALAPWAVHPDWQRKGVGSVLIRWGLDECAREGHELVIVVGHANYYPRFGFVPAMPLGIRCPFEVSTESFMLLFRRA
jgi:putative acetyltransferase